MGRTAMPSVLAMKIARLCRLAMRLGFVGVHMGIFLKGCMCVFLTAATMGVGVVQIKSAMVTINAYAFQALALR